MLQLRQLHKTYANGVHAINDISLDIGPGLFGLLGPNGAGKSSLMRTIATLQEPDGGSIHFDGIDVLQDPQALRAQLGYLPQDFGVYPKVSALELLEHFAVLKGLTARGERREAVDALLHLTNLWDVRKRAVSSYSGGMRQRFGIAQALLGAPRLVIVDEPTSGLDPDERNRFLNLLARVGEDVAIIFSTHIVEDAWPSLAAGACWCRASRNRPSPGCAGAYGSAASAMRRWVNTSSASRSCPRAWSVAARASTSMPTNSPTTVSPRSIPAWTTSTSFNCGPRE